MASFWDFFPKSESQRERQRQQQLRQLLAYLEELARTDPGPFAKPDEAFSARPEPRLFDERGFPAEPMPEL